MKEAAPKKVVVGISGGVDSAVSAYLLKKAGYEVEGVFMKNWSDTKGLKLAECPWLQDRRDALQVAAFLGIPLRTLDFQKEYAESVMSYFFEEYAAGRTPNPDVACNREIKFGVLYQWAMAAGYDYVATGHYARVVKSEKLKVKSLKAANKVQWNLGMAKDAFKDQTYFIHQIKGSQLPHLIFPIGGMLKSEVKELARKIGLPNADRKESMGLCFVGKVRLKDFLDQKIDASAGVIVDQHGKEIGKHTGLYQFTVGQREGIGVGGTGPYYVTGKGASSVERLASSRDQGTENVLFVTNNQNDPKLFTKQLTVKNVHWISKPGVFPARLKVRCRHQGDLIPCTVKVKGRALQVEFARPVKVVAPGQSAVFYRGRACLGGGVVS